MTYSTLQTIAIICYMISAGLLAVSVLIFFLMDMRQIIGRLTGSAQRKALARMRSGGAVGKTGETIVDMSVLEKTGQTTGRLHRRSGRVNKPPQSEPARPAPEPRPVPPQGGAPDYFGAPYPNKTPPSPAKAPPPAAAGEPQTMVIEQEPAAQTTVIEQQPAARSPGGETMDLEQWQKSQSREMPAADDAVEPVKLTILDDVVLLHTEKFIEI